MEHREVSGQDCLDSSDSSLPLSRTPPHPAKNIRLSIDSIQNSPQRHTLAYPCHGDVTPPRPQPFVVPSAPGRKRTSFVPKDDSSSENSSLDDFDGIYPRNYERTRTVPVNIPRINPDIATPNLSNRIAKLSVRKVSPPVIESSDDDLSPEPIECSPSSTLKGHLSLPSKYVSKIEVRDVVGARVNPILKKPPLEGSESGAIALEKISFYDNKMDRSPNFLEIFGVNRSKTKPAPKADT